LGLRWLLLQYLAVCVGCCHYYSLLPLLQRWRTLFTLVCGWFILTVCWFIACGLLTFTVVATFAALLTA
jgi:hypothetical protein